MRWFEWLIRQEQQRILFCKAIAGSLAIGCKSRVETLSRQLPDSVQFCAPTGGYFTWLVCPAATDCEKLRERARAMASTIVAGQPLFLPTSIFGHALRLCHMYYPEPVLREGLERLICFLRDVIP